MGCSGYTYVDGSSPNMPYAAGPVSLLVRVMVKIDVLTFGTSIAMECTSLGDISYISLCCELILLMMLYARLDAY